ncbi:MAG: hypothetical protein SGI90_12400 [Candidatus Eisenbacteria bacterium]|nr:hypothetical protein [Candidatus Eisenbacteria bacterium]
MDDRIESGRAIEALRRKNLEGKRAFIEDLRQTDPKSISLLLEILCDESWFLRELALKSLVDIGEPARLPLRAILSSGLWYTRAAAVRALGRMGDAVSAPHILDMLEDSNRTARDAGLEAMRSLAAAGQTAALGRALAAMAPELRGARLALIERVDPDLARGVEASMSGAPDPPPRVAEAPSNASRLQSGEPPRNSAAPPLTETAPDLTGSPAQPRLGILSLFEIAPPASAEPAPGGPLVNPPLEGSHVDGGIPPGRN